MSIHERALDQDLAHVQKLVVSMGQKVIYMLENSIKALIERNSKLAEETIQFDKEIDRLENQVDQAVYEIIALRQPAAGDLRNVIAAIKINNDIERIGDYCEGICRQAIRLNKMPALATAKGVAEMAKVAAMMLNDCVKVFDTKNISLAKKNILDDDKVDDFAHMLVDEIHEIMKKDPKSVDAASALLLVVSKLERIADQATNISEQVVFSVTGDNIKHRSYSFAHGDEV
ncbi:MAG: phosphate signaling complex protein PhoU [Oligoflexia bacterium]|nr:phosphate signaling complex protein PhoU [Oligoflexia bacterium]